jgi:hypothetical protein
MAKEREREGLKKEGDEEEKREKEDETELIVIEYG